MWGEALTNARCRECAGALRRSEAGHHYCDTLFVMEIRTSARRHGIADPDIHHAIDNAVAAGPVETNIDQIVGVLYIGPDRKGRILEVITVDDVDDGEVAIHARQLREAYERYLPREDRS
jgi:hypothetical protein